MPHYLSDKHCTVTSAFTVICNLVNICCHFGAWYMYHLRRYNKQLKHAIFDMQIKIDTMIYILIMESLLWTNLFFQWKLRSRRPKFPRQRHVAVVSQGLVWLCHQFIMGSRGVLTHIPQSCFTSMALEQLYCCPIASEVGLKGMDKISKLLTTKNTIPFVPCGKFLACTMIQIKSTTVSTVIHHGLIPL